MLRNGFAGVDKVQVTTLDRRIGLRPALDPPSGQRQDAAVIDEVQCSTNALQLLDDALPMRAGGPRATELAGLLRVPLRGITSSGEVDPNGVTFRVSPAGGGA